MYEPIEISDGGSLVRDAEKRVRICRPAFQDSQRILCRLSARAEVRRQAMKLRWWNPHETLVLDVRWEPLPDTDMRALLLDDNYGVTSKLALVFFHFQPMNRDDRAIWVLSLVQQTELFTPITKAILLGRRCVVTERALSFLI